jgi:hypothetical protein
VNSGFSEESASAASLSSLIPSWLPPAALMSIQKTQPTICAARKQTIRFSVGGVTLDASIDCMKIDIVSVIPGRYAHALIGLTTLPIFRFIIQVSGFSIQLICFSSIGSIRIGVNSGYAARAGAARTSSG